MTTFLKCDDCDKWFDRETADRFIRGEEKPDSFCVIPTAVVCPSCSRKRRAVK